MYIIEGKNGNKYCIAQPLTLASFQTWGIQQELIVSVAAANVSGIL